MMQCSIFIRSIFFLCATQFLQADITVCDGVDFIHLDRIKKHLKNSVVQDISFPVFADFEKKETFNRPGILVRKKNALGTVVLCHGYLGSQHESMTYKHLFPCYNVLGFDFRAHGNHRTKHPSTIGGDEVLDIFGAVKYIKADPTLANKPVFVFGYSMGAVAAIEAQALDNSLFDAMILDCPYDSTDAAMDRGLKEKMTFSLFGLKFTIPGRQFIIDHMYDWYVQPLTNLLFQSITRLDSNKVATKFVRVSPVESIKKVTVPCLFIHCHNDKKVPVSAVQAIYHNKPGFKRLWITKGQRHFGSYPHDPELYWYKVNKFLTKLQQQDITKRDQERICDDLT